MGMAPNVHLTMRYEPEGDGYLNDYVMTEYPVVDGEQIDVNREEDFGGRGKVTMTVQLTYGYRDFIEWSEVLKKHSILTKLGERLVKMYGGSYSIHLHGCFD